MRDEQTENKNDYHRSNKYSTPQPINHYVWI